MNLWWQVPLVLCGLALGVALVAAIVALRKTLHRAEQLLARVEQELPPTVEGRRALAREAQPATHGAGNCVARGSAGVDRVGQVAEGVGGLVGGRAGLTRVGQRVGLAVGLRKGVDVFSRRLAGPKGGGHG